MAGLMNWFWDKVGLGDPIEDEEEEMVAEPEDKHPAPPQANAGTKVVPLRSGQGSVPLTPSTPRYAASYADTSVSPAVAQSQVVVFVPQKLEDLPELVRHLREGRLVVTSFDGTNDGDMQHWLNFIFGAACALDGTAQKISRSIYLVAPRNVDITSNLKEILLARDNQERSRDSRFPSGDDYTVQ